MPPLTFGRTIRGISEFIEVAIHTILYVRQVYPQDLFVRRKKYDTPVFQSRHPALNDYISGAVKAIADELIQGNVDKVVVVIKDKDHVPLERFIFSVENMIAVESFNKDTAIEDAMSSEALGKYFRAFLVKLNMIESQLSILNTTSSDVSFAIILELKGNAVPTARDGQDPPPWIPANVQDTTTGTQDDAELLMVRAVNTGVVNLSLAVQESPAKLQREKELREKEKNQAKVPDAMSKSVAKPPIS